MAIRARDLRSNIHEMGFEKGVVHTLELALEELSQQRQYIRELTELQNQLADRLGDFLKIGEKMVGKITQLERDQEQGNNLDGDKE